MPYSIALPLKDFTAEEHLSSEAVSFSRHEVPVSFSLTELVPSSLIRFLVQRFALVVDDFGVDAGVGYLDEHGAVVVVDEDGELAVLLALVVGIVLMGVAVEGEVEACLVEERGDLGVKLRIAMLFACGDAGSDEGRDVHEGHLMLGLAEGFRLQHLGAEPLSLLGAVAVEVVDAGIDGRGVGLVLTGVEENEGGVAIEEEVVETVVRRADKALVRAGQVAARLVVAADIDEGLVLGKQLGGDIEEAAVRNRGIVVIADHVAVIEDDIHLVKREGFQQFAQLAGVSVAVVDHQEGDLLGLGVEGAEGFPARRDGFAKRDAVGLELRHLLRHEAVLILRAGLKARDADGISRVVGFDKSLAARCEYLGLSPLAAFHLHPREGILRRGEEDGHLVRSRILEIRAMVKHKVLGRHREAGGKCHTSHDQSFHILFWV